jgi:uncharacterized membrane protein SpoIIM required for sporulation
MKRQGFSHEQAAKSVEEMVREQLATIRGNGIKKIVGGGLLTCVPIATFVAFLIEGYITPRFSRSQSWSDSTACGW